jgi:hypothetical protein
MQKHRRRLDKIMNNLKKYTDYRQKMMTLEERMARLNPERRAKIEARTDELHREYLAL